MKITIIENGPALIEADPNTTNGQESINVINKGITTPTHKLYLCRCGKTKDVNSIICDGSHKQVNQ